MCFSPGGPTPHRNLTQTGAPLDTDPPNGRDARTTSKTMQPCAGSPLFRVPRLVVQLTCTGAVPSRPPSDSWTSAPLRGQSTNISATRSEVSGYVAGRMCFRLWFRYSRLHMCAHPDRSAVIPLQQIVAAQRIMILRKVMMLIILASYLV